MLDKGIHSVICLEQNEEVGGNWLYTGSPSHSSVCETTHLISSKTLSQFEDFPMPSDYPDYPSHRQVLEYFKAYTAQFGLRPYIRFNHKVVQATRLPNGGWSIRTDKGIFLAEYLVVSNGHHHIPRHPELPGTFTGEYLHAHQFKNNRGFEGKRVLVIGAGNSGCDCAVECSRVAESVDISIRRGHYIVPKFMMGKPTDMFNAGTLWVPSFILNPLRRLALYVQIGAYESYGLDDPEFPVTRDHPTVNSELLYQLRHGKVTRRRGIKAVEGRRVVFEDGYAAEYDVILAATGYKIATPFLDPVLLDFSDADRLELYLRMFYTSLPDLIFVGLTQPQGAIWPLSELQSRLAAAYVAGVYQWPADIQQRAREEADAIERQFLQRKRHVIEVDFHAFRKRLKKELAGITIKKAAHV
jgi:cation diffusion facilitator CzcD-associated flavoprotein CzcO